MHIDGASSIDDHINKAANQDFLMARSTPLPAEVVEPIAFVATTPSKEILSFWDFQHKRVANYADQTCGAQRIWDNAAPPEIKSATGKMKSVAISALSDNYDLGGASWVAQFTVGFPLIGNISQEGISPRALPWARLPSRGDLGSSHRGVLKHAHALRIFARRGAMEGGTWPGRPWLDCATTSD